MDLRLSYRNEIIFHKFCLGVLALALRKSGGFTVISLFYIQTHFNLFGSSPINSPLVAGELDRE